jgi:hypothetical protein
MKHFFALAGICLSSCLIAQQSNEFKIGMFSAVACKTRLVNGCDVPIETALDGGNKTSVLNVLAEDGFNIYQMYQPNEWTSENYIKSYLKLSQANGLKVEINSGGYYKPLVDGNQNYLGYGTNEYTNCSHPINPCDNPYSQGYFRTHIQNFISNICTVSPYKDVIWGYHISEEAAYYHAHQFTDNCLGNDWPNPAHFKNTEIPPTNVAGALSYFKTSMATAGITNHKMVVMEANHHRSIHATTIDHEGSYNPQQYIQLLSKNDSRDIFFEGSYVQYPTTSWKNYKYSDIFNTGPNNGNWHYLGAFKSIDYAKTLVGEVHKVVDIDGTTGAVNNSYNTDLNVPNANWLWFQTYTSIIHGAKGVWFYDLTHSWYPGETNNWGNTGIANRFDRSYFPSNYQNFVAHLAKELAYLKNKNVLSTDPSTILYTKTDGTDPNCIVPNSNVYIYTALYNAGPYGFGPAWVANIGNAAVKNELMLENYGLRYTIRTNGTETYMIITNPLNIPVENVNFDFSAIAHPMIKNSTGVEVLFGSAEFTSAGSSTYKTNRNSTVNLSAMTVGSKYTINYTGNKQLSLSFGPTDTKIIKFVSGSLPNYENGWTNTWSNYGSGTIGGHVVKTNDIIYPGDFDGGGDEELLIVNNTGNASDVMSLLKFVNGTWTLKWTNTSYSYEHGMFAYRASLVVGDYDGDGKDELLGNASWTTLFRYNATANDWDWQWSDYGNAAHVIRPYKGKMYAVDFTGDGKDEILGCDLTTNGFTKEIRWDAANNNFVIPAGTFPAGSWVDNASHPIRQYRDNLITGNFDGFGGTDLLGIKSWGTLFDFKNGDWNWAWTTGSSGAFGGWGYPFGSTDKTVVGNVDSDTKDELILLQTGSGAAWATSMDYKETAPQNWNWNWSSQNGGSTPFIDDWSLADNGGSDTKYYPVKPTTTDPEQILALRKYGCGNTYFVSMYKRNNIYSNYRTQNTNKEEGIITDNTVLVFPNPASGTVSVKVSGEIRTFDVSIYDSQGRVMTELTNQKNNEISVDISQYAKGVYIVKVNTAVFSSIKKLIVQ